MSPLALPTFLDENNPEFSYATDLVLYTSQMLYLTGRAGTGKTTFLRNLKEVCNKKMVILAPTGVAAINAGGQTIHSFFQVKPGIYVPGDGRFKTMKQAGTEQGGSIFDHFRYPLEKLQIIRNLELLVIDEVSMVRCDLLDVVDTLLRVVRDKPYVPFGGVQMILIGDAFQLPPIVKDDDWNILGRFYDNPFFFSSKAILQSKPVYVELKKVYRQTDQDFIGLLNRIRINELHHTDIELLNSRFLHGFSPEDVKNYIILATHNRMVEEINSQRLAEIKEDEYEFSATVSGTFPPGSFPADENLHLKATAQVMFLRNDWARGYYNGKIGHVLEINEDSLLVELPEGNVVEVEKELWENMRYTWNAKENKVDEEAIGSFQQYPLKLAWAITVHKSQGLTFEKIIADLGEAFAPGQVYVALSRCTSFEGLWMRSKLYERAISCHPEVIDFSMNETDSALILDMVRKGKSTYQLRKVLYHYAVNEYPQARAMLLEAINSSDTLTAQLAQQFSRNSISRIIRSSQQSLARLSKDLKAFDDPTPGLFSKQLRLNIKEKKMLKVLLKEAEKGQLLIREVNRLNTATKSIFKPPLVSQAYMIVLDELKKELAGLINDIKEKAAS